MRWERKGRMLLYQDDYGRISITPVRRHGLKPGVTLPPHKGVETWVVSNIFVHEDVRREGHGLRLLRLAASKITEESGTSWLGLMGDTLRGRAASSNRSRQCWEKFCFRQKLARHEGFARLLEGTSWGGVK